MRLRLKALNERYSVLTSDFGLIDERKETNPSPLAMGY